MCDCLRPDELEPLAYLIRREVDVKRNRDGSGKEAGRVGDDPLVRIFAEDSYGRARAESFDRPYDRSDVVRELTPGYRKRPVAGRHEERRRVRSLGAEPSERLENHLYTSEPHSYGSECASPAAVSTMYLSTRRASKSRLYLRIPAAATTRLVSSCEL